jgi:hypothetical protein
VKFPFENNYWEGDKDLKTKVPVKELPDPKDVYSAPLTS